MGLFPGSALLRSLGGHVFEDPHVFWSASSMIAHYLLFPSSSISDCHLYPVLLQKQPEAGLTLPSLLTPLVLCSSILASPTCLAHIVCLEIAFKV